MFDRVQVQNSIRTCFNWGICALVQYKTYWTYMFNSPDITVHSWILPWEIFHNIYIYIYILLTKAMYVNYLSLPSCFLFGLDFHILLRKWSCLMNFHFYFLKCWQAYQPKLYSPTKETVKIGLDWKVTELRS